GAKRGEERGLVIGRPAKPAVTQPSPCGDGVAGGELFVDGARCDEVTMREAAPFGGAAQYIFACRVIRVQRVVEPRDHTRGVAERRMVGDLADALAVDPDLAAIVKTVEEFLAGVRQRGSASVGHGSRSPSWVVMRSHSHSGECQLA